jgi:hypothetical protein
MNEADGMVRLVILVAPWVVRVGRNAGAAARHTLPCWSREQWRQTLLQIRLLDLRQQPRIHGHAAR